MHILSLNIPTSSLCAASPAAFLLTTLTVLELKCSPQPSVLINIVLLTKNSRHWQPQVSSSVSALMMNPTAGPHFGHSCFLIGIWCHVLLGRHQVAFISSSYHVTPMQWSYFGGKVIKCSEIPDFIVLRTYPKTY